MPAINVYLSEEEYLKLASLASGKGLRASLLARVAIKEWLEKQEVKAKS